MNTYWVVWTYIANYGVQQVRADSPEKAFAYATSLYSKDFHAKAEVFVFDRPPAFTVRKGVTSTPTEP